MCRPRLHQLDRRCELRRFFSPPQIRSIAALLSLSSSRRLARAKGRVVVRSDSIALGNAVTLAFGGGLMNIVSYFQSGLESSINAWAIGTAINTYGLIWNVVAAIGAYER